MTYIKDKQDEVLNSLSDLYRLLIRKVNNHPELFSKLDKARIENANKVMMNHAKPFDPKQILRRSNMDSDIKL